MTNDLESEIAKGYKSRFPDENIEDTVIVDKVYEMLHSFISSGTAGNKRKVNPLLLQKVAEDSKFIDSAIARYSAAGADMTVFKYWTIVRDFVKEKAGEDKYLFTPVAEIINETLNVMHRGGAKRFKVLAERLEEDNVEGLNINTSQVREAIEDTVEQYVKEAKDVGDISDSDYAVFCQLVERQPMRWLGYDNNYRADIMEKAAKIKQEYDKRERVIKDPVQLCAHGLIIELLSKMTEIGPLSKRLKALRDIRPYA